MTEQETALYDAMTTGDWQAVEDMRQAAYDADPTPDPDTGLTPIEQFDEDYANAWRHYQADHEAPQYERETATRSHVHAENERAGGPTNMALFGLSPHEGPTGATVHALGTHFVAAARVYFDGSLVPTTVVSPTELTFPVPGKPLGSYDVFVRVGQFDTVALSFTITEVAAQTPRRKSE